MAKLTTGTALTERFIFNSGYLTIGGDQFVDLDNVSVEVSYDTKEVHRLNSITMGALRRSNFRATLRRKIKSFNRQLLGFTFGSSSVDGTGSHYINKDGQYANALNPVLTCYIDDLASQAWQYQFTDAIITSLPLTASVEEFGELDFEMIARQVSVYTDL